MLLELWSLVAFSFLLVSGAVVILLAAAGAIMAGRLAKEALDKKEPQDPFDIAWPEVHRLQARRSVGGFPHPQPIEAIFIGEEQAEEGSFVQEQLPF